MRINASHHGVLGVDDVVPAEVTVTNNIIEHD